MKRMIAVLTLAAISVAGCAVPESEDATTVDTVEETSAPPEAAAEEPAEPEGTTAQQNALRAAEQYLATMPFSHTGLINQLVQGDGYTEADATWAADHVEVDWNEQAARAAQSYLDVMAFSRAGLVEQLVKGDGYTPEQAEYGVDQTGL